MTPNFKMCLTNDLRDMSHPPELIFTYMNLMFKSMLTVFSELDVFPLKVMCCKQIVQLHHTMGYITGTGI